MLLLIAKIDKILKFSAVVVFIVVDLTTGFEKIDVFIVGLTVLVDLETLIVGFVFLAIGGSFEVRTVVVMVNSGGLVFSSELENDSVVTVELIICVVAKDDLLFSPGLENDSVENLVELIIGVVAKDNLVDN